MDDRIDGVVFKHTAQGRLVGTINFVKNRTLSGDGLDAINDISLGVGKVIGYNHLIPGRLQLHYRMASNISGTAGDKNGHNKSSYKIS